MILTKLPLSVGALTLLAGLALVSDPANAQQEPATIYISGELSAVAIEYYGDRLAIYSDGGLCGELSLTDPAHRTADGGAEFELGASDQPAACGTEGADLTFVAGDGTVLANSYTLEPGIRIELDWFHFGAHRDGLDEGHSDDGQTYLTIDAELRESGRALGFLDVFADGQLCGQFSFDDMAPTTAQGGAEFHLGEPGQPEVCGRDGSIISLINPSGVRLSEVYRLTTGQRIAIQNFTIRPPHTGDGDGPAPAAPETGAGLVGEPDRSSTQMVLGVGTLLLLVGVVLYVMTRRRLDQ